MRYEHFIARRYLRSRRQLRFINIIMLVSVIGITVGVAALIIVLSVFNGFSGVVTQVLVGFDPHVRLEAAKGKSVQVSDSLLKEISKDPRITGVSPFAESKALLVVREQNRVVYVRGVVDTLVENVSGVSRSTILGEFRFGDTKASGGIVLGLALADRLGATVGTDVTVISPVGVDAMLMQFGQPLMRKCTVVGIYDSNNKDYDAHYAYVSLETAKYLFQYKDGVSGIEFRLQDIQQAEQVKLKMASQVGDTYSVSTWYDLHKDLYSVMKIERWSAYLILCLIVGVATFNVLGSLTMGVVEKKRDIGVLKSIGASHGSITRIFMFEGLLVGAIGTGLGLCIGLLVCYLQIHYHLFPLDPNIYIIPAIPVEVRWMDFFTVAAASMVLCTLASLYPARRAARLLPVAAIRWE
ncbi:MAG TPA: permease [Bacteroidetes bacterium]|jgi:lipoprotein-releasing system permease protein|nr:permease [Bacteroidota bacterium]